MLANDERPEEAAQARGQTAPRSGDAELRRPGVTELLQRWSAGDETALTRLVPLIYDELRQLARRHLRHERDGHTLRGTALVHEAFMRMVNQRVVHLDSRAQFFGWASQVMRHILVNHARDRRAGKRGGGAAVHSLEALQDEIGQLAEQAAGPQLPDLVALDEALKSMERLEPRMAKVVELRFFGGLNVDETAQTLQISPSTVVREWAAARAWLLYELGPGAADTSR